MKKFLLIVLMILFAGILSCQLNQSVYIETDYLGEYYVFCTNEIDGDSFVLVLWQEKRNSWAWADKEYALGGSPAKVTIEVIKILGLDYPDYGILTVKLFRGDEIVAEAVALQGEKRAILKYEF